MQDFIKIQNLLPRKLKIHSENIFSTICFVMSVKILDPQFQGQAKEKLINRNTFK